MANFAYFCRNILSKMNLPEINTNYNIIGRLLETLQLAEAIARTEVFADELHDWQLTDKVKNLRENYRLMLGYAIEGVTDPEQKKIYNSLVTNCYHLADEVKESLLSINSLNFIYSQKRYLLHTGKVSSQELVTELEAASTNAQLPELLEQSLNTGNKKREYAQQHELLGHQLFKQIWLANYHAANEIELFRSALNDDVISTEDKCLAVSALTLSLLRYFDDERLLLLIEQCENTENAISQRALVGLLPILAKYDARLPLYPAIRNRLVVLFDSSTVAKSVKRIILQYARSNETEKITRKLQEEILPEMMKIAPKIQGKIDIESMMKNDDPDERNPEWQDILEKSGIADKLKEFSELQMEGSDVYMSTFAQLKNFSFFGEISNWFRPFNFLQSDICELFEQKENSFISAMMNNSFMCNSDRYSFCLSLAQMPESQREMMSKAFAAESEQLKEIEKEENILNANKQGEIISNAYIQDLYRFFKLFRFRDDFENPFDYSLKLHNAWFFGLLGYEIEDLKQTAEYFFLKNFYPQSIQIFLKIEKETEQTADLHQKMGYCYQQMGETEKALQYYLQADIMQPNHLWTIRKIAYCYRLLQNYPKALEYYLRAEQQKPDNQNIQIQIGNCYLHNKQYDEALAYYFKIEYNTENNLKMWRAIAWTSFLADKSKQAVKYYEKAIEVQPDWTDYLNLGHTAWCAGDRKQAVEYYKQAIAANEHNISAFVNIFNEDKKLLIEKGIEAGDIALVLDYLRL